MNLNSFVTLEAFLLQIMAYLLLWWWDDYLATLLSLIFGGIALFLLVISRLVEWVERSRVSKAYYRLMLYCFLAPLLAGILGLLLRQGVSWME
ncbi:MAG: hypothetical protein KDC54_11205 [Lewinella sp.]|nr:hypothetical protein [Lewinella sp.]